MGTIADSRIEQSAGNIGGDFNGGADETATGCAAGDLCEAEPVPHDEASRLAESELKVHSDGRRSPFQRLQSHAFVLWVEQAVQLRAARSHARSHTGLGKGIIYDGNKNPGNPDHFELISALFLYRI